MSRENVLSWVMLPCESHVFLPGTLGSNIFVMGKHCSVTLLFNLGFDVDRSSRSSWGGERRGSAWEG